MLTFQVIAHELGSKFNDGLPRVRMSCQDADSVFNEIRIPVKSHANWPLGSIHTFTPTDVQEVPNPF